MQGEKQRQPTKHVSIVLSILTNFLKKTFKIIYIS